MAGFQGKPRDNRGPDRHKERGMGPLLLPMALFAVAASPPPTPEQPHVGATFETNKGLGELEKCLTDKLSQRGDVTAMQSDTSTTLMLRWGGEAPMLIEL